VRPHPAPITSKGMLTAGWWQWDAGVVSTTGVLVPAVLLVIVGCGVPEVRRALQGVGGGGGFISTGWLAAVRSAEQGQPCNEGVAAESWSRCVEKYCLCGDQGLRQAAPEGKGCGRPEGGNVAAIKRS
jgi:hypothetical protein